MPDDVDASLYGKKMSGKGKHVKKNSRCLQNTGCEYYMICYYSAVFSGRICGNNNTSWMLG